MIQKSKQTTFLLLTLLVFGCAKDRTPAVPEIANPNSDQLTETISLQEIFGLFEGDIIKFKDIQNGEGLVVSGIVISSDDRKNIQNRIYIQNAAKDPSVGATILINETDLFLSYAFGDKILLKLDELGMAVQNGELVIGSLNGESIAPLEASNFSDFVINSGISETVEPLAVSASEIQAKAENDISTDDLTGVFISLENVQVVDEELGESFANVNNAIDVQRTLLSCSDGINVNMLNSGQSNFKADLFPEGNGTVQGIVKVDDTQVALLINSPADVSISAELSDRCAIGPQVLLREDFESLTALGEGNAVVLDSWINNSGTSMILWDGIQQGPTKVAQIYNPNTSGPTLTSWLVAPTITTTNKSSAVLQFDVRIPAYGNPGLNIQISTDFAGTPEDISRSAQWTKIGATLLPQAVNTSFQTVEIPIDLVALGSPDSLSIAFNFIGRAGEQSVYQIDDIILTGE